MVGRLDFFEFRAATKRAELDVTDAWPHAYRRLVIHVRELWFEAHFKFSFAVLTLTACLVAGLYSYVFHTYQDASPYNRRPTTGSSERRVSVSGVFMRPWLAVAEPARSVKVVAPIADTLDTWVGSVRRCTSRAGSRWRGFRTQHSPLASLREREGRSAASVHRVL